MIRFAMESALAAFFRTDSRACARPTCLLRNSFLVYWKIPASHRDAGQGLSPSVTGFWLGFI